ncbi:MAG: mannose-1-phosphate guanylyltransferase/mannose-6-phosphate isomerase [Rhodospirillaceae bacterium]|nr:mannose-1-phosphate guanylyltransferase/mannose-6-phosphate isomerase [Rhodospirillaceae bacterium]|tara:strand:- start:324 stop:1772 length:1449 start_codon:yes stop_codon:yes gene_type:complete
MSNIYPVILSGGSGTRLWPISRSLFPKQFLNFNNENSFFQETVLRFHNQPGYAKPIVICNAEHRFIVKEQLSSVEVEPTSIILEGQGRNTAAAAAIAALKVSELDQEGLVLLLASDHLVTKPKILRHAIQEAKAVAINNKLVTFGIPPGRPETGYGYIQIGNPIQDSKNCYYVDSFIEKPDETTARTYLSSGKFLWNSSLFLFRPESYIKELQRFNPNIALASKTAFSKASTDLGFVRLDEEAFGTADSISIDYAVMENTKLAAVVPVDPGWSDIGSWASLWEVLDKDDFNNACIGDVVTSDTANTLIHSTSRLVTAVGVENVVIAETADAVMVVKKDRSQDVKTIVDTLRKASRPEIREHELVHRPWGSFEVLNEGPNYLVKRITVNPGASLSLQSHQKRSEHWVVIEGVARVTLGPNRGQLNTSDLYRNQSTYIPAGLLHRLENKQTISLIIIEVQTGDYLDESDIKRFEDIYGRTSQNS